MRLDDHHWILEADGSVATLWLRRGLSTAMLASFTRALDLVQQNPTLEFLVLRSLDPGGFPTLPDIESYRSLASEGDRIAFAVMGQRVLQRLSDLPLITIAYLEGECLGVNFELAISCDYRIAVSTPVSRLGFHLPTVPPCWGGLTRLTRRFGASQARGLLETRTISFREARRRGFVDRVCAPRRGKAELADFLDQQRESPRKPRDRFWNWAYARKAAPPLQQVIVHATRGLEQGLAAERKAFVSITSTPAHTHSLAMTRQAQRQLGDHYRPLPARIGIVGHSDYLADFAVEMAIRGTSVCTTPTMTADRIQHALDQCARQGRITPLEQQQSRARIQAASEEQPWQGFLHAEWVLVDQPQVRLPELESHLSRHALLVLLDRPLAWELAHIERPDRVVSARPPLVPQRLFEIGVGSGVTPRTVESLRDGLSRLGLTPVFVQDHPKLVSRRIWAAMADEAIRLIAEGVPIAEVDALAASLDLGKPLEFLDGLGLSTAMAFVPRLRPLVIQGLHGRPEQGKQGDGFYKIAGDGRVDANVWAQMILWDRRQLLWLNGSPATHQVQNMQDRLLLRVVNEASAVLCEESFASPAEIDLLAAWTQILPGSGGPLSYADARGLNEIVRWLRCLQERNGDRFRPHSELIRRAAAGERFHDHSPSHLERIAA